MKHRTHVQVTGSAHAPGGFVFWCSACPHLNKPGTVRWEWQSWDDAERAGREHEEEANA